MCNFLSECFEAFNSLEGGFACIEACQAEKSLACGPESAAWCTCDLELVEKEVEHLPRAHSVGSLEPDVGRVGASDGCQSY